MEQERETDLLKQEHQRQNNDNNYILEANAKIRNQA